MDRCGSIGAAAKSLHLTPTAVSQQLKAIGRTVKMDVFEVRPSGSRCTPAGKILVEHARRAIEELDQAEEALRSLVPKYVDELSLVCFPSAVGPILTRLLVPVAQRYPDVRMKFDVMRSSDAIASVVGGDADVGIVARYPADTHIPHGFAEFKLDSDHLCAVLQSGHRLGSYKDIAVESLSREPLIVEGEHSQSFLMFLMACQDQGVVPSIQAYCPDAGVALSLVSKGHGVAIVPGLALHGRLTEDITAVPLAPALSRSVCLVTSAGSASLPIVQSLVHFGRLMSTGG